jgi:hypothetical protein
MIDLYRIMFPKERLQELMTEERSLFFLRGYAANQIAIFKKLTVFATNIDTEPKVRSMVEGARSQILVRHLVGVVTEAWELIDKRFLNKPIGREYRSSQLGPTGEASIAALQKQFGSSNILNNIRNQYAFHHPYNAEVDTAFATAAANPEFDDEWNWYLAKENINCFYFISDMVVIHGMLKAIGEDNLVEAQKKMHKELKWLPTKSSGSRPHFSMHFCTNTSHLRSWLRSLRRLLMRLSLLTFICRFTSSRRIKTS